MSDRVIASPYQCGPQYGFSPACPYTSTHPDTLSVKPTHSLGANAALHRVKQMLSQHLNGRAVRAVLALSTYTFPLFIPSPASSRRAAVTHVRLPVMFKSTCAVRCGDASVPLVPACVRKRAFTLESIPLEWNWICFAAPGTMRATSYTPGGCTTAGWLSPPRAPRLRSSPRTTHSTPPWVASVVRYSNADRVAFDVVLKDIANRSGIAWHTFMETATRTHAFCTRCAGICHSLTRSSISPVTLVATEIAFVSCQVQPSGVALSGCVASRTGQCGHIRKSFVSEFDVFKKSDDRIE